MFSSFEGENVRASDEDCDFETTSTKSVLFTQDDFIRYLSKETSELLAPRLKDKKLLYLVNDLVYCNDDSDVLTKKNRSPKLPTEWIECFHRQL